MVEIICSSPRCNNAKKYVEHDTSRFLCNNCYTNKLNELGNKISKKYKPIVCYVKGCDNPIEHINVNTGYGICRWCIRHVKNPDAYKQLDLLTPNKVLTINKKLKNTF